MYCAHDKISPALQPLLVTHGDAIVRPGKKVCVDYVADPPAIRELKINQAFVKHYWSFIGLSRRKKKIIIQHLIQQIAHSITNYHLSLMFLLHVSTSTRSSSERYTQSQISTANSVKRWACVELKYNIMN
jgi:hypothetical protein